MRQVSRGGGRMETLVRMAGLSSPGLGPVMSRSGTEEVSLGCRGLAGRASEPRWVT